MPAGKLRLHGHVVQGLAEEPRQPWPCVGLPLPAQLAQDRSTSNSVHTATRHGQFLRQRQACRSPCFVVAGHDWVRDNAGTHMRMMRAFDEDHTELPRAGSVWLSQQEAGDALQKPGAQHSVPSHAPSSNGAMPMELHGSHVGTGVPRPSKPVRHQARASPDSSTSAAARRASTAPAALTAAQETQRAMVQLCAEASALSVLSGTTSVCNTQQGGHVCMHSKTSDVTSPQQAASQSNATHGSERKSGEHHGNSSSDQPRAQQQRSSRNQGGSQLRLDAAQVYHKDGAHAGVQSGHDLATSALQRHALDRLVLQMIEQGAS